MREGLWWVAVGPILLVGLASAGATAAVLGRLGSSEAASRALAEELAAPMRERALPALRRIAETRLGSGWLAPVVVAVLHGEGPPDERAARAADEQRALLRRGVGGLATLSVVLPSLGILGTGLLLREAALRWSHGGGVLPWGALSAAIEPLMLGFLLGLLPLLAHQRAVSRLRSIEAALTGAVRSWLRWVAPGSPTDG